MKRLVLIKHLQRHDCIIDREGGNHTLFVNKVNGKYTAVPRHAEIKDILANKICKQLGIPKVK